MEKSNEYQVIREDQLIEETVVYIYRGDKPVMGVIKKVMSGADPEFFQLKERYYHIDVLMSDTDLLWEGPRTDVYVKTLSDQSSR